MQNTGKRCVILLFFIILRWSFNYESNVFRYNKILIDCVFGNSKFLVPSTLTIDLGFASVNSQRLRDNKLAIPSYPVNMYIMYKYVIKCLWLDVSRLVFFANTPPKHDISVYNFMCGCLKWVGVMVKNDTFNNISSISLFEMRFD
jgi:hypothetical protein